MDISYHNLCKGKSLWVRPQYLKIMIFKDDILLGLPINN